MSRRVRSMPPLRGGQRAPVKPYFGALRAIVGGSHRDPHACGPYGAALRAPREARRQARHAVTQ